MHAGDGQLDLTPQEKGGRARKEALTAEQRSEIARKAAEARWSIPCATHEGELHIGGMELACAVLEDGTRVLSERGTMKALGLSRGGYGLRSASTTEGGGRLPLFLAAKNLRPFIDNELQVVLSEPLLYRPLRTGKAAHGLRAELIPKVCEVWLRARDAGALAKRQLATAAKADALVRALARVGIVALVDEATGYQDVRDRLALQALLDRYLQAEFASWAKRFPDAFYQEIFRLRGWDWNGMKVQRPPLVGLLTNDVVYSRLAPGILRELQERNPKNEKGRRRSRHHQWLTEDVGHPALAQHLHAVVALMRASENWEGFKRMLNKALPKKTRLDDLPLFADLSGEDD